MTLTIALNQDAERRLLEEAARRGLAPDAYAAHLIEEHLPAPSTSTSLAEMFQEWDAEDATDDPSEIARRNAEFEELKQRINANRAESEGPGARKPFPESR
jgi:hypothetical protein